MWQMTLRNIWQRRLRSVLTILGIAVAVQVNLTIKSVISGYESDLKGQMRNLAGRVFVQRPTTDGSAMEEFPSAASSISDGLADALLDLEGIDGTLSSAILYIPLASSSMSGLPPAVSAVDVILSNWLNISLLAILAGLGASLLPAWRAVQVDPLEALRYE